MHWYVSFSLVKEARRGSVDARQLLQSLTGPKDKPKTYAEIMKEKLKEAHMLSASTEFTYIAPQQRRKSVFQEKLGQVKQVFKRNPDAVRKPLLEVSLLKDFPFFSLCVSILFFTSSMMSTFVFLPPLAKSTGVSELQSAYLVSIIGVCDSVARFSSGFILDMKNVKRFRLLVYNGVMFGVGLISMIMPSLHGFAAFGVAAGCYGALCGTYVAQKSVVVVDVLGVEKMISSYGLLLGFQGIGSLIGPTISGNHFIPMICTSNFTIILLITAYVKNKAVTRSDRDIEIGAMCGSSHRLTDKEMRLSLFGSTW